jgi:hypothetical protein
MRVSEIFSCSSTVVEKKFDEIGLVIESHALRLRADGSLWGLNSKTNIRAGVVCHCQNSPTRSAGRFGADIKRQGTHLDDGLKTNERIVSAPIAKRVDQLSEGGRRLATARKTRRPLRLSRGIHESSS